MATSRWFLQMGATDALIFGLQRGAKKVSCNYFFSENKVIYYGCLYLLNIEAF